MPSQLRRPQTSRTNSKDKSNYQHPLGSSSLWKKFLYVCIFQLSFMCTSNYLVTKLGGNNNNDQQVGLRREENESLFVEEEDKRVSDSKNDLGTSRYAYLWIIGSVHEERTSYKGFLWDIIVSINVLREAGSTADFWVYVRLSPDSKLQKMPEEDLLILEKLNVNVKHLDKVDHESFLALMYDKFLILNMTAYDRVMYLDSDTLPLTNLDYLFHLSDPHHTSTPTLLKPNFIYATRGEPCNGGLFFLQPSSEIYQQYLQHVETKHEYFKTLPYPHFDRYDGWGYNFGKHDDKWVGIVQEGTRWNFHGSHVDQGLMYYVARFMYKHVSIAIGNRVQNWRPAASHIHKNETNKISVLESETDGVLQAHQPELLSQEQNCLKSKSTEWRCVPPYNAFSHFYGSTKPWQNKLPSKFQKSIQDIQSVLHSPKILWYKHLYQLNNELKLGIDFENYNTKHLPLMKESPLGYLPMYKDQSEVMSKLNNTPPETLTDANVSPNNNPITNNNTLLSPTTTNISQPKVVAYAVSFIKCGDHQNSEAGLIDASLVLRHSIHKISCRNPSSGSKFDYKMYAIVHEDAKACSSSLQEVGFEVKIVKPPLQKSEIRGDFLRTHIHKERCCGHDEFIKLYAYTLPHEIIVHVDIDVAFYKPMDHLFNAILYDKDSTEGKYARSLIELERPGEEIPDKIGAFITRDWTQVFPGKWPPGYQAGFLVARRDPSVMEEMVEIVKEGNYTEGWGYGCGWANLGYAGYVGAMAMQGLVAYYYDHINTNNAVELNQCLYNHVGVDVKIRGRCRNGKETCEDCMATDISKIYNMHHTTCRKPWQCQAIGAKGGKKPNGSRASAINIDSANLEHCLQMTKAWHLIRSNFEESLYNLTNDQSISEGANGDYRKDIFLGHCSDDGSDFYLKLLASKSSFRRVEELY